MRTIRTSEPTTNHSLFVRTMLAVAALAVAFASEAHAQSFTPVAHGRAVAAGQVTGVVKPILTVRRVGEPVRLEDGRFEQRYTVVANVAFRFVSAAGAGDDVRCADATGEVPLAQLDGRAGYHTEFRVRAGDEAALAVTAEQR